MDFKSLKKMANEEVKKLIKKEKKVQGLEFLKSITDKPTPGEQIIAENIERKLMKPVYDAGIRQIYVARKENFVKNHRYICIKPLVVFNNPEGNEIKVNIETDFGHPYSFQGGWYPKRFRLDKIGRDLFDSYRKRSYFYPPYVNNRLQLNTEELATLWHFPGRVGETPTLGRIESKRGEPPVNLPV